MRKKKLKIIEDYIFAKSLNLLAKNTNVSRENIENFTFLNKVLTISETLLKLAEQKIQKHKLNNVSFLILKNELESIKINYPPEHKLNKLKEMMAKISI